MVDIDGPTLRKESDKEKDEGNLEKDGAQQTKTVDTGVSTLGKKFDKGKAEKNQESGDARMTKMVDSGDSTSIKESDKDKAEENLESDGAQQITKMVDTDDSTLGKGSDKEKTEENLESDGARQPKVTDTDNSTPQKESDKGKAIENPKSDGAQQPKINETATHGIVIEAEPLAWKPPADQVVIKPAYIEGQRCGLPEGWYVEQRPRTTPKYIGKIDQFYYEPGTRKQFRSLKAVLRHLQVTGQQHEQQAQAGQENNEQSTMQQHEQLAQVGQENDEQTTKEQYELLARASQENDKQVTRQQDKHTSEVSKSSKGKILKNKRGRKKKQAASGYEFDHANPLEKITLVLNTDVENDRCQHGEQFEALKSSKGKISKNKCGRKKKQPASTSASGFEFDYANPPKKVTWTLNTNVENDRWIPSIGETMAPEAVKDLWAETFVSLTKKN
ncbi:Uncharacterized protein TCM_021933 [Theobroma cacao]|uniref:MBD domain-containing protein n=1 Tax=Theobroma cacao TaxID=3641 RepID=A0A061ERP4_THECC|nr:Uncharacterized protein TCM_021933 [Theobroma cacao]